MNPLALLRRSEPVELVDEAEWEPGDPLFTDNGPGAGISIRLSPEEMEAACAEDSVPPPWHRPVPETASQQNRECKPCGVRWKAPREDDSPCWVCGAVNAGIPNGRAS